MAVELTKKTVEAAVYGGAILGGGGGGWIDSGLQLGNLALDFGYPQLVSVEDISPETEIITVAAVGAPAAKERHVKPFDYVRVVEMIKDELNGKVGGIITNENGASTTVNGWLQSAVLGIPVIDAPCNGRAHPISTMGAMGLTEVEGYVSIQAASGGNPKTGKRLELVVRGNIHHCSNVVRNLAVEAGGIVAVARNPVKAEYAAEKGAPGAILQAIEVGNTVLKTRSKGPRKVAEAVTDVLNGEVVTWGKVKRVELETRGGFDIGEVVVDDGGKEYSLTFWNEYMTLECREDRLATFPDLIMTISMEDATPLTTAKIKQGQEVAVIKTHRKNLKLGAGMFDRELYKRVEETIGKSIISYIFRKGVLNC